MSVPVRQFQAASGVPIFYPFGTPGDIGPQGPATPGPRGPTGPAASGGTGATGPAGPVGPQGFPGPTGAAGAPSRTGPTGPSGPAGLAGFAGAGTGATGPAGVTGPPGNSVNPAGLQQLGPITVRSGDQPSLYAPFNGSYQVGYFVARCISNPLKSVVLKLYGLNQSVNPLPTTDMVAVVGNNNTNADVQMTSFNVITPGTNYASLELVNNNQSYPGPYLGVQLKSFFTGGGTETWVLSCAPNQVSANPF